MSHQITVTLGRSDQELAEFLAQREGLSGIDKLVGISLRNQLYALKEMSTAIERKDSLLTACINRLTPDQVTGIIEEMPELLEREFPDEWSANQILWSYTATGR